MTDENTRLPSEPMACQADRERAASIAPPGVREGILSGQMDGGKYVRAFTAHRNDASTLPSDSVVEALKPYLRHKSDCRLYANCVDYECTCGLCDILAAQPRDDVRELLKVARADLAFLHEQIQQHRPGTYRAGNTIARIDTALSQGDEQPDTDGLAKAYGRAVRALANAGSLQPTIGTVNLMLCDLGEDLGEVPLSALRTDRKAVLEEAANVAEAIAYKPNPRLGKALGRRIAEEIRAEGAGK